MIPFFVMSWRFDVAADQSLSMDMIKAKGIITGGYSLKARRGDIASEVTVQFKTRDGADIITTENISSYAFKNFHEGQEVDLIYSKKNPRNIDLLISGDDTKDITRSEERDITPADLIALTTMESPKIEAGLDKICYGWEMDQTDSSWTNIKRNMTLKIKPEGLIMVTDFKTACLFSGSLPKQGYKPAISNPKQPYSTQIRTFENDSYMFMVQLKNIQNNLLSVIKVVKK